MTTRPIDEYMPTDKTLTPTEALADFELPDDLAIQLVANEPAITDPVAIAFDEDARLYVVEMGGYPNGPENEDDPQQSRIRLLDDRDGDGFYETSTIYVDELTFPTGAIVWDGGLYVTCAPHIYYFKDTDDDGRADTRRIAFTGFGEGNQQHRVNGLKWGLDNWIYVANGDSGGDITAPKHPGRKVSIRNMDFRFRPGTEEFEAVSGKGQFGVAFDDWGRRFFCSNRRHVHEVVLPDRYLRRNPNLVVRSPEVDVSDHGDAPQVFPRSVQGPRWIDITHVGQITSACGLEVYRGVLLPAAYHGNVFVAEPVANLVHRDVLTNLDRPAVTATRARPDADFLTATDVWSRPVFLANGPDGALYVVDMYRQHIEHPQWIAPVLLEKFNVQAGNDRGRIYRIVPKGTDYRRPVSLSLAGTTELVRQLNNPNGWVRDTAHRLLIERRPPDAAPYLRDVALSASLPQARVHAMWVLDALGQLEEAVLERTLVLAPPRVREHAVRLSESWFAHSTVLRNRVLALAPAIDARLRFQVALSLGEFDDPAIVTALAIVADRDPDSPWTRAAVLSSLAGRAAEMLRDELASGRIALLRTPSPAGREWVRALSRLVGAERQAHDIIAVLKLCVGADGKPPWWQLHALQGLTDGLKRGVVRKLEIAAAERPLKKLMASTTPEVAESAGKIAWLLDLAETPEQIAVIEQALSAARDSEQSPSRRVAAIGMLAFARSERVASGLQSLLHPQEPTGVQAAAVTALSRLDDSEALHALFERFKALGPTVQTLTLDVILRRSEWADELLDAVADRRVPLSALDAVRRDRLTRHPRKEIRERSAKLFAESNMESTHRQMLDRLRPALSLSGSVDRGRPLFEKLCSTCHKVGEVGHALGPDLTGMRDRPAESLLTDILVPSQAVAPGYTHYTVQTRDGQILTGVITAETANNITLGQTDGVSTSVLRSEIEEMSASNLSFMPEGLAQGLTTQDLADLLAFLKALPTDATDESQPSASNANP